MAKKDTLTIDTDRVNSGIKTFNDKKKSYTSAYKTFKGSYLNTGGDATVTKLKNTVSGLYASLNSLYNGINSYSTKYINSVSQQEQALKDGLLSSDEETEIRGAINAVNQILNGADPTDIMIDPRTGEVHVNVDDNKRYIDIDPKTNGSLRTPEAKEANRDYLYQAHLAHPKLGTFLDAWTPIPFELGNVAPYSKKQYAKIQEIKKKNTKAHIAGTIAGIATFAVIPGGGEAEGAKLLSMAVKGGASVSRKQLLKTGAKILIKEELKDAPVNFAFAVKEGYDFSTGKINWGTVKKSMAINVGIDVGLRGIVGLGKYAKDKDAFKSVSGLFRKTIGNKRGSISIGSEKKLAKDIIPGTGVIDDAFVINKGKVSNKVDDVFDKTIKTSERGDNIGSYISRDNPNIIEPKVKTEAKPKVDIPEQKPKVDIPEQKPKVDIPEQKPKVDIPEQKPKVDIPEQKPKVDIPEQKQKEEFKLKTDIFGPSTPKVERPSYLERYRGTEEGYNIEKILGSRDKFESDEAYREFFNSLGADGQKYGLTVSKIDGINRLNAMDVLEGISVESYYKRLIDEEKIGLSGVKHAGERAYDMVNDLDRQGLTLKLSPEEGERLKQLIKGKDIELPKPELSEDSLLAQIQEIFGPNDPPIIRDKNLDDVIDKWVKAPDTKESPDIKKMMDEFFEKPKKTVTENSSPIKETPIPKENPITTYKNEDEFMRDIGAEHRARIEKQAVDEYKRAHPSEANEHVRLGWTEYGSVVDNYKGQSPYSVGNYQILNPIMRGENPFDFRNKTVTYTDTFGHVHEESFEEFGSHINMPVNEFYFKNAEAAKLLQRYAQNNPIGKEITVIKGVNYDALSRYGITASTPPEEVLKRMSFYSDPSIMSCAIADDPSIHVLQSKDVKLVITLNKNTGVLPIGGESEVLVQGGLGYRPTKAEMKNGQLYIYLK